MLCLGVSDYIAGATSRRSPHPGAAITIAGVASMVGIAVAGVVVIVFPPEAFTRSDLGWSVGAGLSLDPPALVSPR